MVWLAIVGLALWVFFLQRRVDTAEGDLRDLHHLRGRLATPARDLDIGRQEPTAAAEPQIEPVAAKTRVDAITATPEPAPIAELIRAAAAVSVQPAVKAARPAARATPVGPAISTWLSENGLAWLGGGALALGGVFLVAYAAQQGFFTPILRIWAAIAVGATMLGAGEWIRRQNAEPSGRHALAAAMVTGAGAATLYAAVWAAYGLYHFIGFAVAGTALAGVSIGLLALAFLHGEALALLAILAAFAAPPLCGYAEWNDGAMDGYWLTLTATGLATTALRGWARAGLVTLIAAAAAILARAAGNDPLGAGSLVVAAPAMTVAALYWRRARGSALADFSAELPKVALIGASVLWFLLSAFNAGARPELLALAGAALLIVCALAIYVEIAPSAVIGAPVVALVVVAEALANAAGLDAAPWLLVPALTLMGAGGVLVLTDRRRSPAAIIAAAGTALTLTLLRAPLARTAEMGWLIFVAAAGLLAIGATLLARRSSQRSSDLALGAWVAAAAEAVGLAIHTVLPGLPEPIAYGALAIALAVGAWRLDWRGFAESSVIAALASVVALLGPSLAGAALSARLGAPLLAGIGLAAAATQVMVWLILRRRPNSASTAEAVSTMALISLFTTAFLVLHIWGTAQGSTPASLDSLTEAALRTVLLLVAGLALTLRGGATAFARGRGPVILGLGAVHGLLIGALIFNPWWGLAHLWRVSPVTGPPLLDSITLAYLAPALLLAATAWRQATARPAVAALAAMGGGLFGAVWTFTEVRRLFHNPLLAQGALGYAEAAAYGVATLVLAVGVARIVAARASQSAATGVRQVLAWIALIFSGLLFIYTASPWWGPLSAQFDAPLVFFALFGAGVALTAYLAWRAHDTSAAPGLGDASAIVTLVETFAFLTLLIRFAFHGAAMRTPLLQAGAETWTYSAAWALFGVAVLVAGARTRHQTLRWLGLAALLGTTLKVFLFDMAMLSGVIRAGSFIVLGALLIVAGLAARRLGAAANRGEG